MQSKYIWAKSSVDKDGARHWLPLWMHLQDTMGVTFKLWDEWLPQSIKNQIQNDLKLDSDSTKIFIGFLSGVHDLGKATPDFSGRKRVIFQTQDLYSRLCSEGFSYQSFKSREGLDYSEDGQPYSADAIRHEVAGAAFLKFNIKEIMQLEDPLFSSSPSSDCLVETLLAIIAGHHGSPSELWVLKNQAKKISTLDKPWVEASQETYVYINSLLTGIEKVLLKVSKTGVPQRSQILLTSIVIMSDWLASSEQFFPQIPVGKVPEVGTGYEGRLEAGWALVEQALPELFNPERISETASAEQRFAERFNFPQTPEFKLRPIQSELIQLVSDEEVCPVDLFIVEAPMGDGKTEAALLAAEILMKRTKSAGFFIGLPTMATGEAMYLRVEKYATNLLKSTNQTATLALTHSKATLSKAYTNNKKKAFMNSKSYGLIDEGWLQGSRMKLLNSFAVGTVDNFLMLSLKVKYNYWRHLGFASKVIIIDEVHSTDDYMIEYLKRSLEWAGFYNRPVILLSATLATPVRNELIEAYQKGKKAGNAIL